MKHTIISSKDLFNPHNNPKGRLDAKFGILLSQILKNEFNPTPKEAEETLKKLLAGSLVDNRKITQLLNKLADKKNLQEAENTIAILLIGSHSEEKILKKYEKLGLNPTDQFSEKMKDGIKKLTKGALLFISQKEEEKAKESKSRAEHIKNLTLN